MTDASKTSSAFPLNKLVVIALMSVGLILMIVAGLMSTGTIAFPWGVQTKTDDSAVKKALEKSAEQEKLKYSIKSAQTRLEKRNEVILKDFMATLKPVVAARTQEVRGDIPKIVDDLTSYWVCMKLSYKMVKDKICDTHDVSDSIAPVLNERYITPVAETQAIAIRELDALARQLNLSVSTYESEVATALNQTSAMTLGKGLHKEFLTGLETMDDLLTKEILTTATVTLGVAIDAVCIQGTVVMLKNVFKTIVAKMVASSGTAAIMGAADGPLPIGDIVGTGVFLVSTAWAAWDIHQIQKVLPEQMTKVLNENLDTYEASIIKRSEEVARNMLLQVGKKSQDQTEKMISSLE